MNLTDILKNGLGPRTNRKIVVFSVDDYGVQRTASLEALMAMEESGLDMRSNRFDRLDSLETPEDLTELWETLDSVRDKNNRPAIFTAFACPANIDFEYLRKNGGNEYRYKLLPELYSDLGYNSMMQLWHQGLDAKVVDVQYHGREHANIKTLLTFLNNGDYQALTAINNNSWSGITHRISPNVTYVSATQFDDVSELPAIADILSEGVNLFENVWRYRPRHFTSPGNRENHYVHQPLAASGIKYIDTNFMFSEHQGGGKYKRVIRLPFSANSYGQYYIIRNIVFEPMLPCPNGDWEDFIMKRIASMFYLGKPVNISTHRVNFSGNISRENRHKHLAMLKRILKRIVTVWPEVEFMSTIEMAQTMIKE